MLQIYNVEDGSLELLLSSFNESEIIASKLITIIFRTRKAHIVKPKKKKYSNSSEIWCYHMQKGILTFENAVLPKNAINRLDMTL